MIRGTLNKDNIVWSAKAYTVQIVPAFPEAALNELAGYFRLMNSITFQSAQVKQPL